MYGGFHRRAIGIKTTNVTGIGTTDKLPRDLFIVKVGDGKCQICRIHTKQTN